MKSKFLELSTKLLEQFEIGLIEYLDLFFVGKNNPVLQNVKAKIDSGNDGYCVLNAQIISQENDIVKFRTINNKILKMKKIEDIIIHVGSGNKEVRPVVLFDIKLGNNIFKKIPFSLGDRSENDEPILISKDFISSIDALINVNKENTLD